MFLCIKKLIKKVVGQVGIFMIACLIIIVGTGLSTELGTAQAGDTEVPPQRLVGYAWSENIGWISFNDGSKPVVIGATGELEGFAWSENVGWIRFGTWTKVPDLSRGINSKLIGNSLTGWARTVSGMTKSEVDTISPTLSTELPTTDVRGGFDGWISLQGVTLTGTTVGNPPVKNFQGYAWGSDILGWITFDKVGIASNLNSCTGPYGTAIAGGQTFTYYTAQDKNGSCQSEERACTNGKLTGTFTEISCGDDGVNKDTLCSRAGAVLKQDEEIELYSKSSVKAGASCAPFKANFTCKNGKFIGSDGMADDDHVYTNCRPLPGYSEV